MAHYKPQARGLVVATDSLGGTERQAINEVGKYGNYGMQEEHNQSIKLPHTGWREPGKAPQGVHTLQAPGTRPGGGHWLVALEDRPLNEVDKHENLRDARRAQPEYKIATYWMAGGAR
eukprot:CAMPEP_0174377534 /NCGR_PEP_ID=MMETSP0811_2-20130205/121515_1 /TAXON_ID=73025 ORGANISM="Eutreptiella gymnastica-like, Strain CCMP1594" /NCGR_SAMPLE_ID=MMETSP0811_2 /ASSEMBLY_ACC=CAM_ASM_000667 /LENGTH=117 /DNA_ID=CAMNT_0015529583 /DNA_START=1148 /DNA_END=1502 /DNA_ORIENTATION=+